MANTKKIVLRSRNVITIPLCVGGFGLAWARDAPHFPVHHTLRNEAPKTVMKGKWTVRELGAGSTVQLRRYLSPRM